MADLSSKFKLTVFIWAVAVVISGLMFAILISEGTVAKWLGLAFLLLAETITAAAVSLIYFTPEKFNSMLASVGTFSAAGVYLIAAAIIALIFMLGISQNIAVLFGVEISLILILAVVIFLFLVFSKDRVEHDRAIERKISLVAGIADHARKLKSLIPRDSPPEVQQTMDKILEEIRYFDKNSEVQTDKIITDKLINLERAFSPQQPLEALPPGGDRDPGSFQPPNSTTLLSALQEIYQLTLSRKDDSIRSKSPSL
ncbi:MAG: hypothetical protein LBE38_05640 [Deltaproteobacteria bacterium]|jgi:ABC-type multidrug transport system fused ATPase/permease subunit|nr:hypothetical protein [Deltaproteobacteria bacterium]